MIVGMPDLGSLRMLSGAWVALDLKFMRLADQSRRSLRGILVRPLVAVPACAWTKGLTDDYSFTQTSFSVDKEAG
jgi:hypothetical protein